MPEIKIDPKKIMSDYSRFEHLIWRIVYATKPEKANSIEWYVDGGLSDKIKELWELIK